MSYPPLTIFTLVLLDELDAQMIYLLSLDETGDV